jgi:hypothetical protein
MKGEAMSKETTYAGKLGDWRRLLMAILANLAQLPDLQGIISRFETLVDRGYDLSQKQAAHAAGKQEASKQLQELLGEGDRLATVLRKSLQSYYGPGSEKLSEFGLKPFRGRRSAEEPEPEAPPPGPEIAAPPAGDATS